MSRRTEVTVGENEGGRLDVFVAEKADVTRSRAADIINGGNVFVNSVVAPKSLKLKAFDKVLIILPDPTECTAAPENIPLDIVYEDGDLLGDHALTASSALSERWCSPGQWISATAA